MYMSEAQLLQYTHIIPYINQRTADSAMNMYDRYVVIVLGIKVMQSVHYYTHTCVYLGCYNLSCVCVTYIALSLANA